MMIPDKAAGNNYFHCQLILQYFQFIILSHQNEEKMVPGDND